MEQWQERWRMAETICDKLGICAAELNALSVAGPLDGYVGTDVRADILRRCGIEDDATETLGMLLEGAGILSRAEAELLDD